MLKNKKGFRPNAPKAVRRPVPAPSPSPAPTTEPPRQSASEVSIDAPEPFVQEQQRPNQTTPEPVASDTTPSTNHVLPAEGIDERATESVSQAAAIDPSSSATRLPTGSVVRHEQVSSSRPVAPVSPSLSRPLLPTPPPTQELVTANVASAAPVARPASVPDIPTSSESSENAPQPTNSSSSSVPLDEIDVSTINAPPNASHTAEAPIVDDAPAVSKKKTSRAPRKAAIPQAKRTSRAKKPIPLSAETIVDSDDDTPDVADVSGSVTNVATDEAGESSTGTPVGASSESAIAKPATRKRLRVPKDLLAKKAQKKRKTATGTTEEVVADGEGSAADEDQPRRRGRRRAETPEDAELQVVDHSKTLMADLVNDMRIGKKFSKHDEIMQREMDHKAKAKLRKLHPELVEDEEEAEVLPAPDVAPEGGVQMRVVNGQIVMDERTLYHDRHAQPGMDNGIEVVEENEFSRKVNSGSLQKRTKNQRWDALEVLKLYTGLRMFGTDFEMIAKMFHNRSRREIKLKFNREERDDPAAITAALVGERSEAQLSMEQFQEMSGMELESTAAIEKEYADVEAANQAEQDAIVQASADVTRRRNNQIQGIAEDEIEDGAAGDGAVGGASGISTTGNGKASAAKSRSKAAKKKNMHSAYGGGEEVEILGDA